MSVAAKEVKAHLKAAKTAVGKKNFPEAARICQVVLALDEHNYTAHVFAGLASLELGDYGNARLHYKTAIGLQPSEQLAWKALADFYDKRGPCTAEEKEDALSTYQKQLGFVETDIAKKRATLKKIVPLVNFLHGCQETLRVYTLLLDTWQHMPSSSATPPSSADEEEALWREVTGYCLTLSLQELAELGWNMLERGFAIVSRSPNSTPEEKTDLRIRYLQTAFQKLLSAPSWLPRLSSALEEECCKVLEHLPTSDPARSIMIRLSLAEAISALPYFQDFSLSASARLALGSSYAASGEKEGEGEGEEEEGVVFAGHALFCAAEGKWREAVKLADKAVTLSPTLCEGWLLSASLHLCLHDNHTSQLQAMQGLQATRSGPRVAFGADLERKLKLCMSGALVDQGEAGHIAEALVLLGELAQVMSHDCHVTRLLVKAHLKQSNVSLAAEVVDRLGSSAVLPAHLEQALRGDIAFAEKDYPSALERYSSALELAPFCAEYHTARGRVLWETSGGDKTAAYSSLVQAAKLDPYDPAVFLLIGHYQRLAKKDLRRAAKCYQKMLDLSPTHTEAAMLLGDVLFTTGDEEEAFAAYQKATKAAPTIRTKTAWLRMGLHQRKSGLFNDAIKSFQKALSADRTDGHIWECLGEAYLARGSHSSALKAFSRAVELKHQSQYCLHQIASIKQLLGQLSDSLVQYAAVLAIEPSYVPALIGRGTSHLLMARAALEGNFDGRAVDCISLALADLTSATRLRPTLLCIWKLIGDSCTSLYPLAPQAVRPSVPSLLVGQATPTSECVVLEKHELTALGCRAYARALQLAPASDSLWHDLATAYYHLGEEAEVSHHKHLNAALNAMQRAVTLNPADHTHWSALGVIASHPGVEKPALAQHAFIKSLQLEPSNAPAWTNLGVLYLRIGNIKLAHAAFSKAQAVDPTWGQAWIGQALVAESCGHYDSMDLFRHATEMFYHPEGSLGYSYWVCHSLGTLDRKLLLNPDGASLNPTALRGLLQARDCLQKYLERCRDDACAYNYLGLLFELEGLLSPAEQALSSAEKELLAVQSTNATSSLRIVGANQARVLSALGRCAEAATRLSSLDLEADLSSRLLLALNLFREARFKESCHVYQQLSDEVVEKDKSPVLTAAAMAAFTLGSYDSCKALLFKAFQSPSPSFHGLVALAAYGTVTNNLTLVQAALQEASKLAESQGAVVGLHLSCVEALKVMLVMFQSTPQADECIGILENLLKMIPDPSQHSPPPPAPLTFHSLPSSPPENLLFCQKLMHASPTVVWSQALLLKALKSSGSPVAPNYQHLLVHYIELKMSSQSLVERGHWAQTLVALGEWAANNGQQGP